MTTLPDLEPAGLTHPDAIRELIGMVRYEASTWRDEPERERDPVEEAGFLDAIAKTLEALAARSTVPEAGKAVEYAPQVIQFDDSGISELVLTDEMLIYGEVASVVVVRDKEGRIAGFQWFTKDIPNAGPKSALASSGAEPVMWQVLLRKGWTDAGGQENAESWAKEGKQIRALYATPQAAPAEDVAGLVERLKDHYRTDVGMASQTGDDVAQAAAALTSLSAERDALKRENKSLSDEIDTLEEEGCSVDDDIRKLTDRAEAAERALYLVSNERDNLSDNLAEITSREQTSEAEATSLRRKLEEAERDAQHWKDACLYEKQTVRNIVAAAGPRDDHHDIFDHLADLRSKAARSETAERKLEEHRGALERASEFLHSFIVDTDPISLIVPEQMEAVVFTSAWDETNEAVRAALSSGEVIGSASSTIDAMREACTWLEALVAEAAPGSEASTHEVVITITKLKAAIARTLSGASE